MSTDATTPDSSPEKQPTHSDSPFPDKGKGKGKPVQDVPMDDGEDDDDDDDDEEEEEEEENDDGDDDLEEDHLEEIDVSAILPHSRRSRGARVDYTSPEALKKAGLTPEHPEEEDREESFVAHDDDMQQDD